MNFISGEWVEAASGSVYARTNPADHDDVVGTFAESGRADAERAATAAAAAFDKWSSRLAPERASIVSGAAHVLRSRADEIAEALTREEGKPLTRARGEVIRTAEVLEYFAGAALRSAGSTLPSGRAGVALSTQTSPLGAVLLITPFNFPLFVTALKLGPALVSGNTVVWKPSPHTPTVSIALMNALIEAGIPPGVVNLVQGSTPELGRALVENSRIAGISFTGSTKVGLDIGSRAAARHVRVQQEMGGKNVLVIGRDCDLGYAAQVACESSFGESGQKCTASGIVVIGREQADELLVEVEKVMSAWAIGPGAVAGTDIGPLVDGVAARRAGALLDTAVDAGAVVELTGVGRETASLERGHFVQPRVLRLPDGPNPLRTEEAFAPLLPMVLVDDVLEGSLDLVATSRMGLSASILTNDMNLAQAFTQRVSAGLVNVNLPTTGVEFQAPFGGWNMSGGPFAEAGEGAFAFYTRIKTVAIGSYSPGR